MAEKIEKKKNVHNRSNEKVHEIEMVSERVRAKEYIGFARKQMTKEMAERANWHARVGGNH